MKEMAENYATAVRDLRECSVCLEDMLDKQPKLLDCKHSFCSSCLGGLDIYRRSSPAALSCPKCKHITNVPDGNVDQLPDNFLLLEVKSLLDYSVEGQSNLCFYCQKLKKCINASVECLECKRYLCDSCYHRHNANSKFKGHVTRRVSPEYELDKCEKHAEQILYVCTSCKPGRMFCDVCMITDGLCHDDDNLITYKDYGERSKKAISSLLYEKDSIKSRVEVIIATVSKQESEVNRQATSVIQAIEDRRSSVVNTLRQASNIENIKRCVENMEKAGEKADQMLTTEVEPIASVTSTREALQSEVDTCLSELSKVKDLRFIPATEEYILSFGYLYDSDVHLKMVSRTEVNTRCNMILAGRDGNIFYVDSRNYNVFEMTANGNNLWDIQTNTSPYLGSVSRCHIDSTGNHIFVYKRLGNDNYFSKLLFPRNKKKTSKCSGDKTCPSDVLNLCAVDENILIYITEEGLYKFLYNSEESSALKYDTITILDGQEPTILRLGVPGKDFAIVHNSQRKIQIHNIDGKVKDTLSFAGAGDIHATINGEGHFLISDRHACKISEITAAGKPVRDVLTRVDGISCPIGLVYSAQNLWVIDREGAHEYLKCFQYSKQSI